MIKNFLRGRLGGDAWGDCGGADEAPTGGVVVVFYGVVGAAGEDFGNFGPFVSVDFVGGEKELGGGGGLGGGWSGGGWGCAG